MFSTSPTGVETVNNGSFSVSVFPNPAKEQLTVSVDGKMNGAFAISVLDITGKLLSKTIASGKQTVLDLTGLASGVYLIRYSDEEHVGSTRFVKQ
jgi:hypothetical protein